MDLKQIKNTIEKKFPTATGALLAGSVAAGTASNDSDIDIIVVDRTPFEAYHYTCFIVEGRTFEVTFFSSASYTRALEKESYKRNRVYSNMLNKGKLLFDKEGHIKEMQRLAAIYTKVYHRPSISLVLNYLRKLHGMRLKACRPSLTTEDQLILNTAIAKQIAKIAMIKQEQNEGVDMLQVKHMAAIGPEKERSLLKHYFQALDQMDFRSFLASVEVYQKPLEPYFLNYSTGPWHQGLYGDTLYLRWVQDRKRSSILSVLDELLESVPALKSTDYYVFDGDSIVLNFESQVLARNGSAMILPLLDTLGLEQVQAPYLPLVLEIPLFKNLSKAMVRLLQYGRKSEDGFLSLRMPIGFLLFRTFCKLLTTVAKEDIVTRYLFATLPLYQGHKANVLDKKRLQHQQIAEDFCQENKSYFTELDDQRNDLSLVVNDILHTSIAEYAVVSTIEVIAVLDFCFATLLLSGEERYLIAQVAVEGMPYP